MSASRRIQRAAKQRAASTKRVETRADRRESAQRRLDDRARRDAERNAEWARRKALSPDERRAEDQAASDRVRGHPLYSVALLGVAAALGVSR